jgi:hypothetical protein
MTFTAEELIDLIDEITVTLGQILLTHRELTEGLLDQHRADQSRRKIDDLKRRVEVEKEKLTQIRRTQQRKKELERLRRDDPKETTTESVTKDRILCLRDQKGHVLGWVRPMGRSRVDVLDRRGQLVGRFVNGKTFNRSGQFVGDGNQGLRVLGQTLGKHG